MIVVMFLVVTIVFVILRVTPGDPAAVMLGPDASARLSASAEPRFGDARRPAGPVLESATAAGQGLRRRFSLGGLSVHEVQLDHGGRGWTVWLVHGPDEEDLVPVLDQALATWRWADETVVSPATAVDRP